MIPGALSSAGPGRARGRWGAGQRFPYEARLAARGAAAMRGFGARAPNPDPRAGQGALATGAAWNECFARMPGHTRIGWIPADPVNTVAAVDFRTNIEGEGL